jgi:CheY-like chemotaxis protein
MKQILVVDDEKNIRQLFQEELLDEGYVVTVADGGREALEKIAARKPDLVIVDIRMPDMNGLELMQEIRKDYQDLPIIVCTALRALQDDYTIWESQVSAFLAKPVDLDDLKQRVKDCIGPAE